MAFNIKKFFEGIKIVPKTTGSTIDETGELEVINSTGKLNYRNNTQATPVSPVVTEAHSAVLTNKTIDDDNNTIQNVELSALKTILAQSDKVIRRDSLGAVVSGNALPNSSEIVTTDSSQTLTNKTLTSPTINTVNGVAATPLTIQSASNQDVIITGTGTGKVEIEGLPINAIDSNFVQIGGLSPYRIQFPNNVRFDSRLSGKASNNNQTGSAISLGNPSSLVTRLTAPGTLTSVSFVQTDGAFQPVSGFSYQFFILHNVTGSNVLVINDAPGALATEGPIVTGTGSDLILQNNSAIWLYYDFNLSKWIVIGGTGAGGGLPTDYNIPSTVINWAEGDTQYQEISSNRTYTFSNDLNGQTILVIIKNTGVSDITLTFPTALKSGILNNIVSPGKENIYTFVKSNNKIYVSVVPDFSL